MLNEPLQEDRLSDARFRLAMLSSGIGMAIVDVEGRWVEVNPALGRLLGYASDELVGRAASDFTHPDDVAASRERLAALASGEVPMLDIEKRYLRRDGQALWAHVNVAAMRDDHGGVTYLIVQVRDITAQHEAEEAQAAQLRAIHRQQDLFAYGVSHDLRAPLRAIDSFASLLATHADGQLDETGRDYLARIRAASARMSELIESLLELSRAARAEMKPEQVDMSLLAEWVFAELADAEPGRPVDFEVQPDLLAYGDERQLKVLMHQLMHNAWKFSRHRPRVRIGITGQTRDGRTVLSIRDEGCGFDMRYAGKLFEPFQRLHGPDQAAGNGIGLAIAKCIVERHHGRLWADSKPEPEPGSGSTFHVELPAVRADDIIEDSA